MVLHCKRAAEGLFLWFLHSLLLSSMCVFNFFWLICSTLQRFSDGKKYSERLRNFFTSLAVSKLFP